MKFYNFGRKIEQKVKRVTIPNLTEEEEDKLEKNLIWIFAFRRSGTTWLANELLSHQTKFMDEPLIGLHLGRYETTQKGVSRTIDVQKDLPNYFFSNQYRDTWKFYLRKLILARIYSQFKTLEHKIVIKEPNGSYASDIISECLPDSKIIVILRDGRDVIDSSLNALKKGGWENKRGKVELTKKNRIERLKMTAKMWNFCMDTVMKCYDSHSKENKMMLRYEKLRYDTLEELKRIYEFVGIRINEDQLNKIVEKSKFENIPEDQKGDGKFKRFATPGKWKENFSDEELDILEQIIGENLKKLGYSSE